jgi:hypothetical protein
MAMPPPESLQREEVLIPTVEVVSLRLYPKNENQRHYRNPAAHQYPRNQVLRLLKRENVQSSGVEIMRLKLRRVAGVRAAYKYISTRWPRCVNFCTIM